MPKRKEINENLLTFKQYKTLINLRRSLGQRIADRHFVKWLRLNGITESIDDNAAVIRNAIDKLVRSGQARIPHGGYVVRRGRGRVVVEPLKKRQNHGADERKRGKLAKSS